MIYEDSWITSLAFASLCRWFFCQDTHGPGFCARDSLQYGPKITGCLNVLVSFPLLLQPKVRNQATSIALVFVSTVLQERYEVCRAEGCYKLPGDECDNPCQNTAPILAWAESRSLPIFPCRALSHLIRSGSGCGWLRGKRLHSHMMNISNLKHNCSYKVAPPARGRTKWYWSSTRKRKSYIIWRIRNSWNELLWPDQTKERKKERSRFCFSAFQNPVAIPYTTQSVYAPLIKTHKMIRVEGFIINFIIHYFV